MAARGGSVRGMSLARPVYVVGSGHAHPERELTSAELERQVPGLAEGWSEIHLGMTGRRVLDVGGRCSDLMVDAVSDALVESGWSGTSLDTFVCGTVLPDQIVPASASYVARAHNAAAVAFDVSAACASFIYALSAATGLMQMGLSTRAAVCAGEHSTAYADYDDPRSCVFWGDSGGAALVTSEAPSTACFELMDIVLNGDNEYPEKVFIPRGGYFRSDARYSFKQVVELGSRAVRGLYERNNVEPSTVRGAVMHQANRRIQEELGAAIDVPLERHWHNYEWAGNQSAAGVVTAFSAGWKQHRDELRDGDHVVMVAVGGGYVGAAVLLRWKA